MHWVLARYARGLSGIVLRPHPFPQWHLVTQTELLGSSPGRALCYVIYSITSFAVEVIEINIITQDLVPAYKKNHTGVGAKITQEPFHILSHILYNYSDLF